MSDNPYQNPDYLKTDQYKDSTHLDARATLHRTYRTSEETWMTWVFNHLHLAKGMTVLECGSGPGWLWRENETRIPNNCQITLTDISEGMVAEAEETLGKSNHAFMFRAANVEDLPFPPATFDLVIANHILYHVADLHQGLKEIRRVLKPNGRFIAATNGENHLQELRKIPAQLFPKIMKEKFSHTTLKQTFRLENGEGVLRPHFRHIKRILFEDSLEVTEAEPLVNYLLSNTLARELAMENGRLEKIRQTFQEQIDREGVIPITKSMGIFIAH